MSIVGISVMESIAETLTPDSPVFVDQNSKGDNSQQRTWLDLLLFVMRDW